MRTCWNCGRTNNIEWHHAFFGTGQRKISDDNGFGVDLCPICHRSQPQGVHGGNRELDIKIKQHCQREYEKEHLWFDFMRLVGRNYLDD